VSLVEFIVAINDSHRAVREVRVEFVEVEQSFVARVLGLRRSRSFKVWIVLNGEEDSRALVQIQRALTRFIVETLGEDTEIGWSFFKS
jgi:hypothetical protein